MINKNIKLIIFTAIITVNLYSNSQKLNIAVSSLDLTYNPFYTYTATEAQYLTGLYEGLVSYHPQNLTPEPGLASSWSLSEDKKVYTFTIRDNAKFSNGDIITAETFRNSFIKLISPETKGEFASLLDIVVGAKDFRTGKNISIEDIGIKVLENNKLEITLAERAPYFTKILCHHTFTPVHPSMLNKKKWDSTQVISSGPYTVHKKNNSILLALNEYYWDKDNIGFGKIELIKFSDHNEATESYNKGDIDWMMGNIDLEKVYDKKSLIIHPIFGTTYYFFNSKYKDFSNPKIRRAIYQLIPWEKIRETQYIPATALVPPLASFNKNSVPYQYNIQESLDILENEGFPKGKGINDIIISIPENSINDQFIADTIKEAVETNTEIKVVVIKTPYPDFFTINRSMDFSISTLSWIGDFADPLAFLEMWTTESNLNDSKFSNTEYDRLLRESSKLDLNARYDELSKAEKILLDNSIVIPISHSPGINVVDTSYISNWFVNSLDIHPFKYLKPITIPRIPGLI